MEIINIQGLTKKFKDFTALDNINLTVKKGEIYGFIGPNGAGKSTTIRIILGLLKPTGGRVTVFGYDAFEDPLLIHQRLAYVPAEANLWGNLTGGEVIDILLNMSGAADYKLRDELIQKFDLDIRKKVRTYSKGNKQKITLIAALASNAELYIFDEPTSGLDPLMEKVFQEHILDLKKQGKTIFLSSHILSEVEKVCDKVAIIKNGKIVDSGSLHEMRHLTRSKYTIHTKDEVRFEGVEGVHNVEIENNRITFLVDNDRINSVLKHITNYKLESMQANPPTLEDLFLSHYETKEQYYEK